MDKEQPNDNTLSLDTLACAATVELRKKNPHWHTMALRLYLVSKGCDGFVYGLSFDNKAAEDLVFPHTYKQETIELITDLDSFEFVKGAKITWQTIKSESGYVVDNPRHSRFRGKFYKRSYWQKKLMEKQKLNHK